MFGLSLTAIAWLIAYGAAIVFAFAHPIYGLFGYFLDYYGHPPMRWWGKILPDYRWSLIIALVTLVAFLIKHNALAELRIRRHPQSKWLVLFLVTAFAITISPLAVWPEKSWEKITDLSKIAILYFLIIQIVRTQEHLRWLMIIQIVGVTWWGWDAFTNPHRSAGRLIGIGGPDSYNDNAASAHLVAVLPLMAAVYLTGKRWEKYLCIIGTPLVLNTFILCNSRGGLMGLAGVGIGALLLTSGKLRWQTLLGMIVGVGLLYVMADQQFLERQQTIQAYEEDASATSRIDSWKGALELVGDHPFGVGGGGFNALSPIYIPEIVEAHEGELRDVHNTFLTAACEWGIVGLFLFVMFLISTFRELNSTRKLSENHVDSQRFRIESTALILGLFGILVAGIFTTRLYAEVIYWLAAFGAVLKNVQAVELEKQLAEEASATTKRPIGLAV